MCWSMFLVLLIEFFFLWSVSALSGVCFPVRTTCFGHEGLAWQFEFFLINIAVLKIYNTMSFSPFRDQSSKRVDRPETIKSTVTQSIFSCELETIHGTSSTPTDVLPKCESLRMML